MAQAMAGPLMAEAYPPMVVKSSTPSCWPRVLRMVPISRLANRPWAMAPRASIRYRWGVMTISLRFKKFFTFSILEPPFRSKKGAAPPKQVLQTAHSIPYTCQDSKPPGRF